MKRYRPIASYSDSEDILMLFPCDTLKPDMADIIYDQYKTGIGNPHKFQEADEEAIWDEDEVREDKNFLLTRDGKHGVRFSRGIISNGLPYGYYIDIYELIPEERKVDTHLDTDSNLATDLMDIMHWAMLSKHNPSPFDGEQTRVVIEHPDGSYEPVSFAWFDKENNIIRLCYDTEEREV